MWWECGISLSKITEEKISQKKKKKGVQSKGAFNNIFWFRKKSRKSTIIIITFK